jgi:hypothetical protein
MSNYPTTLPTHWWRGSNFEARVLAHITCPQCLREVLASDVMYFDEHGTEITCRGCHQRLVLIEPLAAAEGAI